MTKDGQPYTPSLQGCIEHFKDNNLKEAYARKFFAHYSQIGWEHVTNEGFKRARRGGSGHSPKSGEKSGNPRISRPLR